MNFSGSYAPEDVAFLLKPVDIAPIDIEEKERLIQSGRRHYSEMLSREAPPTDTYLQLFDQAIERHRARFAADVVRLARHLAARPGGTIVLVSLARAGTPIGVLLRRTLTMLGRESAHYSISIIRDRGIDRAALDYILARHDPQEVVFIDGWTGKGAIARELQTAVAGYRAERGVDLDAGLYVVADLAGCAAFAATSDDYLIPCSILNATVSGLVSRTVLNDDAVRQGEFHACVYYREFASIDRSREFVDGMLPAIAAQLEAFATGDSSWSAARRPALQQQAAEFVRAACLRYNLSDINRIKPGVGETTRALLRRVPGRLLVRDETSADIAHLLWLAERRGVAVESAPWLPYQAVAVIQTLGND